MSSSVEQLYQEIGQAALAVADGLAGKLLVYAEVEDGVISSDIFYVNMDGIVRFRFCPKPMQTLIYSLWERWKDNHDNQEWRVMCYVIENGKFGIDLIYSDQIKKNEDVSDRRPLAVRNYFGDMKIDYSKPQ